MTPPTPHSITERNRLRDQAYADALALRREAIRDFWRGADHLLASAIGQAERAARRLAARLRRRDPARGIRAKTAEGPARLTACSPQGTASLSTPRARASAQGAASPGEPK